MLKLKAKLVQLLFFFSVCTQFASELGLQDTQTISFQVGTWCSCV